MTETLQTILMAAAVGGVLLAGLRWLWKGFRVIQALAHLVEHELKPNSGESLRDQIDLIAAMLGDHLKESAADRTRLAAVEDFLIARGFTRARQ